MTNEDRVRILISESDRVEWKQSIRSTEVLQAVCALANDLGDSRSPGHVVLGLAKDGSVIGVKGDLDEEQQKLVNRLSSTKLLPTPSFSVELLEREGATLVVICVQPYPVPPVVSLDGSTWIRRGTVTERAREADIVRLQERRPQNRQPFDHRLVPESSIEDLAEQDLRNQHLAAQEGDYDAGSFPEFPRWLAARDLGRISDGRFTPNAAAILLELGYVEQLGRGIRLVRRVLEENGNPPIEVETDGFTSVTVRRAE
jgi:ATP-dependent DNA helicase RecG